MPRLDVQTTDYGCYYSARRWWDDENKVKEPGDNTDYEWHRINQFIFPFHTMITGGDGVTLRSFVPLDDEWAMLISQRGSLTGPLKPDQVGPSPLESIVGFVERTSDPRTYFYTRANKHNDYARDFEAERTSLVCGVPPIGNLQDRAMTELMSNEKGEVIYDRSHEHLGTLDVMCITVRRQVIKAAKALRDSGTIPANVDNQRLNRIRHATVILPAGTDWVKATEGVRDPESGLPVAFDMRPFSATPPAQAIKVAT